jgi:uncharacterized protein YydD (DUF2326 family)
MRMLVGKLNKLERILKSSNIMENKKCIFDLNFITNYFNSEKIDINQVKKFYRNELSIIESREFYLKNRIKNLETELKEVKNEKDFICRWLHTIGF